MSFITVATDFSDVATNAVHYACRLSQHWNMSLTILHSAIVPIIFDDNPMPVMPIEDSRDMAENNLKSLVAELNKQYPNVLVNYYVTLGDITDSLAEYAEEHKPALIIVGNSTGDEGSLWFDSTLISTLRDMPFPVMAIPHGYQYSPIEKICIACDYKKITDTFPDATLKNMVRLSNASLHVLNVDHENRAFGTETPLEAEALHEFLKDLDPTYHYIDNKDISEGIGEFVNGQNIDCLIVIPHRHSFLEGLFHKSNTKAIVRNIHIPVIALHDVKK